MRLKSMKWLIRLMIVSEDLSLDHSPSVLFTVSSCLYIKGSTWSCPQGPCHFNKGLLEHNVLALRSDAYCGIWDILANLPREVHGDVRTLSLVLSHGSESLFVQCFFIILNSCRKSLPAFSNVGLSEMPWTFGIQGFTQKMDSSDKHSHRSWFSLING